MAVLEIGSFRGDGGVPGTPQRDSDRVRILMAAVWLQGDGMGVSVEQSDIRASACQGARENSGYPELASGALDPRLRY